MLIQSNSPSILANDGPLVVGIVDRLIVRPSWETSFVDSAFRPGNSFGPIHIYIRANPRKSTI
jgi:hypothetical protein